MSEAGRFTTGSTLRHVTVMALTGSLGLTFVFLVDFVTLLYVGWLGEPVYVAALGFAWVIQFFAISVGIGFAIAATALVSRNLGARDRPAARRLAGTSLAVTAGVLTAVTVLAVAAREPVLEHLLGAEGEALEVASRFLLISLPSLPLMTFGMVGSSILRAEGDARRAMMTTLSAGVVTAALDPFLIFERVTIPSPLEGGGMWVDLPGFGWGVDGAAAMLVVSRLVMLAVAMHAVVRVHDLAAWPSWGDVRRDARQIFAVAIPASVTQMSTPLGNFLLIAAVARFGDQAVAGWSVASRMMLLAFGGIFALSGAIGGIIGQNFGAGRWDRVARAYLDAMLFCLVYVGLIWALLWLATPSIVTAFALQGLGAEVLIWFTSVGAGAFVFAGFAFVANSAFNNLGRPTWSAGINWARDGVALPAALAGVAWLGLGVEGPVFAQAAATVLVGAAGGLWGWAWIARRAGAAAPRGLASAAGSG